MPPPNPPSRTPTSPEEMQWEIFERLVRIEGMLHRYDELRTAAQRADALSVRNHDDINEIKIRLGVVAATATNAENCANNLSEDMVEEKESSRWQNRAIILGVIGILANLVTNFLQ